MKLSTRLYLLLALTAMPLVSAFAATFTVTVGNNFYSPQTVNVQVGDVVRFVWQAGVHPTVAENGTAWAPFTPSASQLNTDITFNTVGAIPYYCTAHGAPGLPLGQGMNGLINVAQRTPTATLNGRTAGIEISMYPNPSRGQVTVKLDQKAGQDYKLRVSNIIGQEMRVVALKPELTATGLPLDLSDLRAGIYLYRLLVDGKVVSTKRLILQN
jgi:plastocyanin